MVIAEGSPIPAPPASLTEKNAEQTVKFPDTGKYLIVGVPGAFTPPCSDHVPTYILAYDELLKKGIREIYVVAVNDIFVVNAWKKRLLSQHAPDSAELEHPLPHLHFLADRSAEFVESLGLAFDASGLLGNTRSNRFVIVVEDGKAKDIKVEQSPPDLTVTLAESVLERL
ncbi:Redoxin [Peziza echinospora]|nr:Redoxin [Peziza echinospora]